MRVCWRRGPESNRARRICNPLHNRFATAPLKGFGLELAMHCGGAARSAPIRRPCGDLRIEKDSIFEVLPFEFGAGKRSRTVDLNLGKVALYQLSYSRERANYSAFFRPLKRTRRFFGRASCFVASVLDRIDHPGVGRGLAYRRSGGSGRSSSHLLVAQGNGPALKGDLQDLVNPFDGNDL